MAEPPRPRKPATYEDLLAVPEHLVAEIPADSRFRVVPDWVCEVLSPSTARLDRVRKLPIYAKAGVAHTWLTDPLERTLEVFRLERGFWVLVEAFADDAKVRAEPFEAVELGLGRMWG